MKIKGDFITNSSSTAYLVWIPDNFDIRNYLHLLDENEHVKERVDDILFEYNESYNKDSIVSNLIKEFDLLKSGEEIWYGDHICLYLLRCILEYTNIVIYKLEFASSIDDTRIINLNTIETNMRIQQINKNFEVKNENKK